MSAIEPLCRLMGINPCKLTKEENFILEAELFTRLCEGLKEYFISRYRYKDYFHVIKLKFETEDTMMGVNFIRCIINDILLTEEYSLAGIAYYTHTPEDVIYEVSIGKNKDPSSSILRKIIELHRAVRPDLYREIMIKVIKEHPALKQ